MSFKAYVRYNREIAMESWVWVSLSSSEVENIAKLEGYHEMENIDQTIWVISMLNEWGKTNIKGDFEIHRNGDVVIVKFKKKREAVRFKLTWGGMI